MSHLYKIIRFVAIGACLLTAPIAHAQSPAIDIIPASSAEEGGIALDDALETHPALTLSPDKSEIILLEEDAGTVVLGNPAHLNILVDSSRRLIAVPKAPGASYFTVLNKAGDVIMQRHVLVAPPKEKYVRVRKTCYGDSAKAGCRPTQTYYCPDICHEVAMGESVRQTEGGAGDASSDMKKDADQMSDEENAATDGTTETNTEEAPTQE